MKYKLYRLNVDGVIVTNGGKYETIYEGLYLADMNEGNSVWFKDHYKDGTPDYHMPRAVFELLFVEEL